MDIGTRVWLLLLFKAIGEAGLAPISKLRLHRLLFLSNCLAAVFDEVPPSRKVIKYRRGPFYPVAQWDIDRLATMGLLTVADLVYYRDETGWWMNGEYRLSNTGHDAVAHLTALKSASGALEYLRELVFSFGSLDDEFLDVVALEDATYDAPGRQFGQVISFEDIDRNFSARTAGAFAELVPPGFAPSVREELFLYMKYLEYNIREAANA